MFKVGLLMTLIDFDASQNHWIENIFFIIKKKSSMKNHFRALLLAR